MITSTIRCVRAVFLCKGERKRQFSSRNVSFILGVAVLLVLGLGISQKTFAQSVKVSGTVTDANDNAPLPGVNVVVKGMPTRGTSTDESGSYTLTVPSAQDTLVFSFIGYVKQEIPVQGRSTIDVALSTDVRKLNDVVVVGYGTQEKKQITGSVSSVNSEDFNSGSISDPSGLIQGKVPGLVVSTPGGDPNGDPTIRLRGVTSFSGSQEPLVVVDGVVGASLKNVDPNDIESIDVLKDASASAIYGTRGASGVIVVTTKQGRANVDPSKAFNISYQGYYSVETVANKLDMLSADEYRKLNDQTGIGINDLGSSTNWFDQISKTGTNNVHNLSLSGGNQYTTYRISGNFRDRNGLEKGTGFQEINGRLNLTQSALNDNLKITFNLSATDKQSDYGFGEAFRYAAIMNPTAPVQSSGFNTTGGYTEISAFDIFNPVSIIKTGNNKGEESIFSGFAKAEYDFSDYIPGLSAYSYYSLQTDNNNTQLFYSKTNKWRGGATVTSFGPGRAERYAQRTREQVVEAVVNYDHSFDKLQLESLAGYSYNEFTSDTTSAIGGDFITDAVGTSNLGFAQDFSQGEGTVGSGHHSHKIIGFFGRVSLNYDDTYFVNASVRREGSTRFGVNNKWGLFWASGAGIELTSLIDIPKVNQLKIRGSYGVSGNDAPFDGISKLRFAPQGNFFVNGNFVQRFGPVSNANPDLKWEENHEWNMGLDFEIFDSRLTGSAEYYIKTTKDLIFPVQVPVPPNLFPTTYKNIGELQNKGFDASLNYDVFRGKKLNWNTGFTFSTFNTKLTKFVSGDEIFVSNAGSPGLNSTPLIRVKEGEPIGQIWGPKFAGIAADSTWLFYDKDGNKVPITGITREDEQVLGNGLPDFSLGWSNRLNYKNFDFSMTMRGVFGHDMVNTYRLFYQPPSSMSTWNVLQSAYDLKNLKSAPKFSSYFVENASFVKLENLTIGYTVPINSTSQIRKLRLYVSGNNLFTITNYKGIDPSVNYEDPGPTDSGNPTGTPNALAPGIERRNGWYTTRTVSLGVQLDF